MPKKQLRLPTKEEFQNLPRSKQEAIRLGINRYIGSDGQLREIRRFGSRLYPNGKVERIASRKGNRGGGSSGTRKVNEELTTPDLADKKAYYEAVADANAQGMDAGHQRDISRGANGIRWSESQGRSSREQILDAHDKADVPLGNQAGNIKPESADLNQRIKPAEYIKLDKGIEKAGQAPSVADLVKNPTKNYPIYEVGGGVVKKVAPKLAKTAAKFFPVVGSALVFSELGQRAQAAERNPTALNQLQAGISSLEAAAEGASLAAYGSGIGAGLGVAADVVSLSLGLTNGAIDTVRDLVGSERRTP